jgi:hypothetical protein
MNYSVLPLIHYDEGAISESGTAIIPEGAFNRLFEDDELESGIFGITISGIDTDVTLTCIPHNHENDIVYLPNWCILQLQGDIVTIRRIEIDRIPRAKTIRCRVIDNELYSGDIKSALENILYDYKFIQSGMTLTVSMPDIDGQVWIESVLDEDDIDCIGPALLGAEVILDMGEPLIPLPLQEPEPVPVPEPVPELTVEEQRRIAREARLRRFG